MLFVLAIVLIVLGCVIGIMTAFANGMSSAPGGKLPRWPAYSLLAAATVLLLLRHFVHGSVAW